MFFIVLYTLIYIILFFRNILPLLKKHKMKKEFVIATVFTSIVYIAQVIVFSGVSIPTPNRGIDKIIKLVKNLVG